MLNLPKKLQKSPYHDCLTDILSGIKTSYALRWYGLDKIEFKWTVSKDLFNEYVLKAERYVIVNYHRQCTIALEQDDLNKAKFYRELLLDFRLDLNDKEIDSLTSELLIEHDIELTEDELNKQIARNGFIVNGCIITRSTGTRSVS